MVSAVSQRRLASVLPSAGHVSWHSGWLGAIPKRSTLIVFSVLTVLVGKASSVENVPAVGLCSSGIGA